MTKWINRSVVQAPRNGTTSHTVTFTAATAGNLLVLIMEGAVTHTVPTGWTRQVQALNNTEISVYTKTATAGESSFSTTHNGSNYPMGVVVYEFAAGSTWVNGVSAVGVDTSNANATLSGLTGTNLIFAAIGMTTISTDTINVTTWSGATGVVKDVDLVVPMLSTDGYIISVAYWEDSVLASLTPTGTPSYAAVNKETLTFAVKAASTVTTTKLVKTASTTWSVRSRLIKTAASSWAVRARLIKTSVTTWAVRTQLVKTLVSAWAVRSVLNRALSITWNILSNTSVTRSLATTWKVNSRLAKSTSSSWAVRTRATKTSVSNWAVRTRATKATASAWSVRSRLQKTTLTNWAVRRQLLKTALTVWAVKRRLSKVTVTLWNVENSGSPVIEQIQLMGGQLAYIEGIYDGVDIKLVTVSINP